MNYSQEQFKQATLISGAEYMLLESPQFEGQTRCDSNNQYKMYWSYNDILYYTVNTL